MTTWMVRRPNIKASRPGRVVFLDRDGVVLVDRHYLSDPAQVELLPGVAETMSRLQQAGFLLIGLSNQSGIGRGLFTRDDHAAVMTRLDEILAAADTGFDGYFFCPHAPEAGCDCRKPGLGLLDEAARHFSWNPALSWMVGDKASDVELGLAAGLHTVLVRSGHGSEYEDEYRRRWSDRDEVVLLDDLRRAGDAILTSGHQEPNP